jgi:DNA-binding response OmpR family regulator
MVLAVIWSTGNAEQELGHTLVWRNGMERRIVRDANEAKSVAVAGRAQLLMVDRDGNGAENLVTALRAEAVTRQMSIVVMARGDFEASEIGLLEAGANAVLRLPASPEWDERLTRLVDVPVRRESRFSVFFKVETTHPGGEQSAIMATALNLSVSGMLLETAEPLNVGEELNMQFRLPELDELVKGRARVVRLGGPRKFGLEFQELTATGLESVRRYVNSSN